ncbi:hypothetical protein KR018_000062, partial [Drosophila ironensis]
PAIQSEYTKIDHALLICYHLMSELDECLGVVEDMNIKYNTPGRYAIPVPPFHQDYLFITLDTPEMERSSIRIVDSELDLGEPETARSAQELDDIYVDIRYKYIKMKRDFEGTLTHCQRMVDCAERQERKDH